MANSQNKTNMRPHTPLRRRADRRRRIEAVGRRRGPARGFAAGQHTRTTGRSISARPNQGRRKLTLPSGCRGVSHPPDTLGRYRNRSRSGCCGHTEAAPPRAELQGQGGRPGCAETDRAQRAPTRPQRPKTVVRRRRGRGPAKPGRGAENAKNECAARAWFGSRRRADRQRIEVAAGQRGVCQGFAVKPTHPNNLVSPIRSSS